jgi:acyl-coenzyme A thioesterase PaaI-like protein
MATPVTQSRLSVGQQLLNVLNKLSVIPGGYLIFSRIIAWKIPYSATIGARVAILEPGYAKLVLKDRKSIRNHLNSIHAIALTNLGELTSGLALNTGLPVDARGIVTNICTEYLKKARGTLVAECRCDLPTVTGDMEYTVEAVIKDQEQDIVANVRVVWRLGLK